MSGSFQKLKAGLLESFEETQYLFSVLKVGNTNSNTFSLFFFHSSEHLGLGPYHPMFISLSVDVFLTFLAWLMTTGVSSLKKILQ